MQSNAVSVDTVEYTAESQKCEAPIFFLPHSQCNNALWVILNRKL